MSPDASDPVVFSSLYRHGVDEKRRVQLPAKWRPEQGEARFTLILWRRTKDDPTCLLALPPDLIRSLMDKLKTMSFGDPKAEALRRLLGTNADQVTTDKSGRFCLPEAMAKAAGIEKEAVMVGMFDRFQIWNTERYAATAINDEALLTEAMSLI